MLGSFTENIEILKYLESSAPDLKVLRYFWAFESNVLLELRASEKDLSACNAPTIIIAMQNIIAAAINKETIIVDFFLKSKCLLDAEIWD